MIFTRTRSKIRRSARPHFTSGSKSRTPGIADLNWISRLRWALVVTTWAEPVFRHPIMKSVIANARSSQLTDAIVPTTTKQTRNSCTVLWTILPQFHTPPLIHMHNSQTLLPLWTNRTCPQHRVYWPVKIAIAREVWTKNSNVNEGPFMNVSENRDFWRCSSFTEK